MSTEELRYPLELEGHTYEVVENWGQITVVGPTGAKPPPQNAGWAILRDGNLILRFECDTEDRETVLARAAEELAKHLGSRS